MVIKNGRPPVIVIGMHRSGTTMVIKLLQQLGLFVGKDLEPNGESWFFINHNDWLLRQSGAAWHNPEAVIWTISNSDVSRLVEEYLRIRLTTFPVKDYLGWGRYLRGERPFCMTSPWGWKDPRNTFTLPIWLRLFPNAKVVHIYRNGVDVAASLRARDKKGLEDFKKKHEMRKRTGVYRWIAKKGGFVNSVRCLSLYGGFSLWETYVGKALDLLESIPNDTFSLCYEDFLLSPEHTEHTIGELADFCSLESKGTDINQIVGNLYRKQACAFTNVPELLSFYETVKERDLMKKLGYQDIV